MLIVILLANYFSTGYNEQMRDNKLMYSVGALMYTPANNKKIVNALLEEKFGHKFSLAFCLEDTIADDQVEGAEKILIGTIKELYELRATKEFYLPKIFIRVRRPEQINSLVERLGKASSIVTGFNAPKFDLDNADLYISQIKNINQSSEHIFYLMPILESDKMINLMTRYNFLSTIKSKLDTIEEYVLNVRVGGNDLCHAFGLRRHSFDTIYDIRPVSAILTDILSVFSRDYVVSGPVWEYYNGENWEAGLANELRKDMLCGFVGKTAVHPKQIGVINESCKVLKDDYEDAKAILNWSNNSNLVSGSNNKSRMNEYKTHYNWANRIIYLAEYYGIK